LASFELKATARGANLGIERKEGEFETKVIGGDFDCSFNHLELTMVPVGYHARNPGRMWYEYYEYTIESTGRWDPVRQKASNDPCNSAKNTFRESAKTLGSDLFQREVWAPGDGVEIVVSYRIGSMPTAISKTKGI